MPTIAAHNPDVIVERIRTGNITGTSSDSDNSQQQTDNTDNAVPSTSSASSDMEDVTPSTSSTPCDDDVEPDDDTQHNDVVTNSKENCNLTAAEHASVVINSGQIWTNIVRCETVNFYRKRYY